MNKKFFIAMSIIAVLYIIISIIIFSLSNQGLHLMLGWNMILAYIPFIISYILYQKKFHQASLFLLIGLWLIFFPNAMYIMTDLIYIDSVDFIGETLVYPYNIYYLQDGTDYILFFHILLGVILGIGYAVKSFEVIYHLIKKAKNNLFADVSMIIVSFLSSMAIYLGRFLRFNSWDFIRPWDILVSFFNNLSWFFVVFVIGMTILQVLILFLFVQRDLRG